MEVYSNEMTSLLTTRTEPLPHPSRTGPFAEVVFNLPVRETFTYEIPPRFAGRIQIGMRVLAPFGRRRITGYVVGLPERWDKDIPLKPIEDLPDTSPVLSEDLLSLTRWMADYYFASWGETIKAALPAGLDDEGRELLTLSESGLEYLENGWPPENEFHILEGIRTNRRVTVKQLQTKLKDRFRMHTLSRLKQNGHIASETDIKRNTVTYRYEKTIRLATLPNNEDADRLLKRSPKQRAIFNALLQGEKTLSTLARNVPAPSAALKKLKEKGLIEIGTAKFHHETEPGTANPDWSAEPPLEFTTEQELVYETLRGSIEANEFGTYLLHGVTGSGKTEIYMRCIQRALELGKTAIMGVPEISLTPQTVDRFRKRFGNQVAILHSGLTTRERYLEWRKIREGRVSIVVGARSAVFAPFENLGVIVIDEEHDASYKQDSTPRYHARDTAIVRARMQNAVVILGSATPSLESRRNVETGKYHYLALQKRIQDRLLPVIEIIDLRKEREEKKNFSLLSVTLRNAIRNRLERGEQTFLFLNRRGTANYVFCRDCGYVFDCARCSVTLTFHGNERALRCHYCNYTTRMPRACHGCDGEVIRFRGFGTQQLEDETREEFPNARIVRLDRDTTRTRDAFETMHRKMNDGEIDILIGTQMITKGHDFPNVTLVGVTYADLTLNIPDFRSCERAFQLFTQVAGRAGRGKVPGQVMIQTHHPDHYVFRYVQEHDHDSFSQRELKLRDKLSYPPCTRMAAVEIESGNEQQGEATARNLKKNLAEFIARIPGVELLGPSRAAMYRINNKFRWHLILRAREVQALQSVLRQIRSLDSLKPSSNGKVKLTLDVDPVDLL